VRRTGVSGVQLLQGLLSDLRSRPKRHLGLAFIAVSNGDNSNILTARIARETFEIPNVVARIYDPRRAQIYQRLGILPEIATGLQAASQLAQTHED